VQVDVTRGADDDLHLNGHDDAEVPDGEEPPIRLVLVEPRALFGAGVRQLLDREADMEVVAEVRTADEAINVTSYESPDVLVVDNDLPDAGEVEATRRLKRLTPDTAMIILGHLSDDDSVFRAVQTGAAAHVVDEEDPALLLDAIRRVADGQDPLGEEVSERPAVAQRVADAYRELATRGTTRATRLMPMSPRQHEILQLVARGMSNDEIAEALQISRQTVKNHLTSVMRTLGVRRRGQAVMTAVKAGWLTIER
jgi:two-component system response regulator DegU